MNTQNSLPRNPALVSNPNQLPKRKTLLARALVVFVLATVGLLVWTATTSADEMKQLNIVVNQLDGATMTDWNTRQSEINAILAQTQYYVDRNGQPIYISVTISKVNMNQNPTDTNGVPIAPDGKVLNDDATIKLTELAEKGEVANGGLKVWVAKEVRFGTNSIATNNMVVNGSTIPNSAACMLQEQHGANGDSADWAHEICHAIGLNYDLTNDTDTGRLMYAWRITTNGRPAGAALTEEECRALNDSLSRLSPTTKPTWDQQTNPPAKSASQWMIDGNNGPVEDPMEDLRNGHLDFNYNLQEIPNQLFNFNFTIRGVPTEVSPFFYRLWLDTDNDSGTGTNGYDVRFEYRFLSTTNGAIQAFKYVGPAPPISYDLGTFAAQTIAISGRGPTNGGSRAVGTLVSSSIPLSFFTNDPATPLATFIRALLTVDTNLTPFSSADMIGPELVRTTPLPEPSLQLSMGQTLPGSTVSITGQGFSSNCNYQVLFKDGLVATGVSGPSGQLSASFTVPQLAPGNYLIDIIDDQGLVQIAVLRILNNNAIPTLTEWGLIVMGLLLLTVGTGFLLRHRRMVSGE